MLRALVRLILIVVVLVAVGAFFFGYRWGTGTPTPAEHPIGTAGRGGTESARPVDTERAREKGAEIGEKVAVGANEAERAMMNASLTAKIKSKMALDDGVQAARIDVDTADGVVTLTGRVRSQAERERAVQLARETRGVTSVVDRLRVQ